MGLLLQANCSKFLMLFFLCLDETPLPHLKNQFFNNFHLNFSIRFATIGNDNKDLLLYEQIIRTNWTFTKNLFRLKYFLPSVKVGTQESEVPEAHLAREVGPELEGSCESGAE